MVYVYLTSEFLAYKIGVKKKVLATTPENKRENVQFVTLTRSNILRALVKWAVLTHTSQGHGNHQGGFLMGPEDCVFCDTG